MTITYSSTFYVLYLYFHGICGAYQGFFLYVLFVKASIFHSICVLFMKYKDKMSLSSLKCLIFC